jgi:hypothetical protein
VQKNVIAKTSDFPVETFTNVFCLAKREDKNELGTG